MKVINPETEKVLGEVWARVSDQKKEAAKAAFKDMQLENITAEEYNKRVKQILRNIQ